MTTSKRFALHGLLLMALSPLAHAELPPLLDRELFFGNPQLSSGQLSPDGKMITFLKPYNGIMNVWIKEFDQPFEAARPLTDSQRPLYGYGWTEDGKYILYVKDQDGDENMNLFAVDPSVAVAAGELPPSRNLTPLDEVTAQLVHTSQRDPDLLWVGLNDRDKAWHDLYRLRISTGELTLIYENLDRITSYDFDWDDNLRLLYRTDEQGTTTILRIDGDNLEPIYETLVTESASVVGWSADNSKMYLVSNRGDLDLLTLFLMDPHSGEKTLIESDPEQRVDFGSLRLDRNTRQVISTSYTDDRSRNYWQNKAWEANYKFLENRFPGREIAFQSSTLDYSKFLISVSGDRYASEAWFFDAKTRELIFQYTPRPELKEVEAHLAPMEPVRYASSDGLEISGYLTTPVGVAAEQLPLVVLVHGGPKGPRDYWGYDPLVQFLANRGYAVLQPNFRASGGYGKAFLNAGDLQWGRLMQDDITWGVKHLIASGVADPERVCIMGGSYGGYATLAGLAFTPDLYACGVDIVGPSNIFTLLDSIPAYWEAGRAFLYGMVGDPNTEEGRELIRQASPLFSAESINRPLLIIQGANDPRVKKAEADQIVIALRDRGHAVSYLLADDEGHGFAKPVNRMAMYAEVERFLAEQLGGRYQGEMPEEVARRLEELRVDIDSVTYTPADQAAVADRLPEGQLQLVEGAQEWAVTLAVQGQSIPMKTTRTYARDGDGWLITDRSSGPLGDMSDAGRYTADLVPVSRLIKQGGQTIEVLHQPEQLEVKVGGQALQLPVSGALLCDGPARDAIIASWPIDAIDSLVFSMLDPASMKIGQYRLAVAGMEKLEGREYVKLSIAHVEETSQRITLWLDAENRRVDRVEQLLPALGGATLTMQRQ
jgi:dipeptidyl aminopeptidase/acylaminoacyl peptidase